MVKKTVTFKSKIDANNSVDSLDKWVEEGNSNRTLQKEDKGEKRFTVVVSNKLYKKMKIKCAEDDMSIKEFITTILEKELSTS